MQDWFGTGQSAQTSTSETHGKMAKSLATSESYAYLGKAEGYAAPDCIRRTIFCEVRDEEDVALALWNPRADMSPVLLQ